MTSVHFFDFSRTHTLKNFHFHHQTTRHTTMRMTTKDFTTEVVKTEEEIEWNTSWIEIVFLVNYKNMFSSRLQYLESWLESLKCVTNIQHTIFTKSDYPNFISTENIHFFSIHVCQKSLYPSHCYLTLQKQWNKRKIEWILTCFLLIWTDEIHILCCCCHLRIKLRWENIKLIVNNEHLSGIESSH